MDEKAVAAPRSVKSPALAGILSFFLPEPKHGHE